MAWHAFCSASKVFQTQESLMSRAQATTNHNLIRQWAESRKGHPAFVKATEGKRKGSGGLLRIDFDPADDSLDHIGWDEFFETFDKNELAFLYQDKTASGRKSRFNKFVSRDTVDTSDSEDDSSKSSTQSAASSDSKSPAKSAKGGKQSSRGEDEDEELDDEDDDLDDDDDDDDDDFEDEEE
jgi:hypothetical protein